MGSGSGKNPAKGCVTLFVLIFFAIFVLPILLDVLRTFSRAGLPLVGIIPTLVWIVFLIAFLRIVGKILKSVTSGKQPGSQGEAAPEAGRSEPSSEGAEWEYDLPKTGSARESTERVVPSGEVLAAFAKLGCNPRMTYTQVSERYYELVKKTNAAKMDEERRQARLRELEEAFEIVTRYYSEIT